MKRVFFLLMIIGMMFTATAQKDSSKLDAKPTGTTINVKDNSKSMIVVWSEKDSVLKVLDYKAVKHVEIGGKKLSPVALARAEILFAYPDWIITVFNVLETATTGLSKAQLTQLQQLLLPYVQAYQQEALEKSQQKKQE